jgi:hypothetical protein
MTGYMVTGATGWTIDGSIDIGVGSITGFKGYGATAG